MLKKRAYLPLKVNMLFSAISGIVSVLFPLIIFPYISRVLGVDGIGRYDFSYSIVNYFILIAGLGISKYAIREGSQKRLSDDYLEFVNEIFTINLITTVFAYAIFVAVIFCIPGFRSYIELLLIMSLLIASNPIGVDWVLSINEDYLYITITNILFKTMTLILVFTFVKNQNDLLLYAFIISISTIVQSMTNYIYARRYSKIELNKKIRWKQHLKPILILFGMNATVTIYVSSDITILGLLCGEYSVGIYAASVKVYNAMKTVLSSMFVASIPRLSFLLGNKEKESFNKQASEVYYMILTFVLPIIVGVILLKEPIILIIAGSDFISATTSLMLLAVALFFCMGAWYWGQCVMLPLKMDKKLLQITMASAIVNVVLNIVLIPLWRENAAALATILAEGISFICCWYYGRKYVEIIDIAKVTSRVVVGCLSIVIVYVIINMYVKEYWLNTILVIILSILIYFLVEVLIKNPVLYNIIRKIVNRIHP